jgi:hypothetical protein
MKAKEFGLSIELGNAEMLSPNDVAWALKRVVQRLERGTTSGTIMDANGNTVGAFGFR